MNIKSKVMTIANALVKQGVNRSAAMVRAWITVKLRRMEVRAAGVTHGNRQTLLGHLTRYKPEDITVSKQSKPNCPLIGTDGNIFNLVGIASRTLKRNALSEQASEMTTKVFDSRSYEEALGIIGEYVNITSVDEPDENIELDMR